MVLMHCAPFLDTVITLLFRMTLEGCPDLPVGELSFRAKNNAMLHIVHLLLGRMDEPYEVQKCGVFRIDDMELLV